VKLITINEIGILDEEIDRLVGVKRLEKPGLSYRDALLSVSSEAPDLFRAKTQLLRRPAAAVMLHVKNGRLVANLDGPVPGAEQVSFARVEAALLAKVDEKMKAAPALQYHEALKLVASENPDLNKQYTDLSRRRMEGRGPMPERVLEETGAELGSFAQAEAAVLAKVEGKMKAAPALQYHEALRLVASENPELNKQYTELSRRRMEGRE